MYVFTIFPRLVVFLKLRAKKKNICHVTDIGSLSRENSNDHFEGVGGRVIKTL